MTFTIRDHRKADSERATRPSPNRSLMLVIGVACRRGSRADQIRAGRARGRRATTVRRLPRPNSSRRSRPRSLSEPGNLTAWQELGAAYIRAATETGNPSFYSRAEAAFDEAEALDPGNPTTTIGLGVLALARHDFELASETATQVVANDPFNSQALLVLVDAEIELGQYEKAAVRSPTTARSQACPAGPVTYLVSPRA